MAVTSETSSQTISPVRLVLSSAVSIWLAHWTIILPVLFVSRLLYKRYASPLRRYPGPWLASVSRLWKVISTATTNTHWQHIDLHRKYGRVVRIAPDEVSISSPEAARLVLSAGKHFYKTDFYGVFPPPENPDIFTEVREHVHAQKKKVANVPYSMAAMQQLSPFINDAVELLMTKLDAIAGGQAQDTRGPQVDLGAWLHYFAFDVLGEVAFSRSFGFLEQGRDVENAIKTIDNSQRYNGIVGQVPELDYLLRRNPLWKFIPALDTKNALITRMALEELGRRKPFDKESEGRWRGGDGRQDLLASLIKGHLKDPSKFAEGDVFAVAHGAIFAGSDSTASTMQSFFWQVLHDRRIYEKLVAEVDAAVADGTIPPTGNVSWSEVQNLTYFQACLRESMRVRPAVGLNITRIVPPEGAELDGIFFPGGTRVAVNGWVLHRDKATFGQDADQFRPERWTEDEERSRKMDRYMVQFGGGAHVCIGRNLALLEINKVLPRLLRDFRFALVHPERQLNAHATFFVVQEGLDVYIEKRV
ncbi:hypothetical protein SCUCBS95973_006368 [Sporothrix curviconia]|uniref:Uncharacterized protein n=1 Tax=Sporothrix curviconia TaxID=1260050 RepID=A0ABP0C5V4_9PEZI